MTDECTGETCSLCRNLFGKTTSAEVKISEEIVWPYPSPEMYSDEWVKYARHPATNYVCKRCFGLIMGYCRYFTEEFKEELKRDLNARKENES